MSGSTTSSPICIDANLVVRRADPTGAYQSVHELWQGWARDRKSLVAPTLLRYEVANALHRSVRAGTLVQEHARAALVEVMRMPIRLYGDEDLHLAALDFASRYDLAAAYDAHYLALAQHLGCEFWTDDQRLLRLLRGALAYVRALDTFPMRSGR